MSTENNTKPKRRWLRTLIASVVAIVLVLVSIVGLNIYQLIQQLNAEAVTVYSTDGSKYEIPSSAEIAGELNILLIGSDDRQDQGGNFGKPGELNADVIMLLHVSADRKNAVAVSFPRDLMVPIPSCQDPEGGEPSEAIEFGQINSTLEIGGPNCVLQTIQGITGIDIPHLGVIDFKGVVGMSEALGGVEVCVAVPIRDSKTNLYLDAGYHTLEGLDALQFLRTRYGVGDGSDIARISNQQVFLSALVRKVKTEGVLTNPVRLYSLADAAASNMQLSEGLANLDVMVQMARTLNDVDLEKISFVQVPIYYLTDEDEGRVGLLAEQSEMLFAQLRNDQPVLIEDGNSEASAITKSVPANPGDSLDGITPEVIDGVTGTNAAAEDICSE